MNNLKINRLDLKSQNQSAPPGSDASPSMFLERVSPSRRVCSLVNTDDKVAEKWGSVESNFPGRSGHKSLTGQVMVGGHAHTYHLSRKRFVFALSKPCPSLLCIWVNTPFEKPEVMEGDST